MVEEVYTDLLSRIEEFARLPFEVRRQLGARSKAAPKPMQPRAKRDTSRSV